MHRAVDEAGDGVRVPCSPAGKAIPSMWMKESERKTPVRYPIDMTWASRISARTLSSASCGNA